MTKTWLNRVWQLGVASSLAIGNAIALSENYVCAQIQPDSTLGSESSVVNPVDANSDRIDGGAIRDTNLFHSFQEFNVGEGRSVYFANPQAIENIFSRVTGNNPSQIQGVLGVLGDANLFLLNPNGIIFGENASLNVNGSFVATTANAVQFGSQGIFSATNPETPSLLTINPTALLFNQINQNAAIANNSRVPAGKDLSGIDVFGLRVPNGKSLSLIGGNVSMDGGWAIASGGRIELGGLTEAGSIGIQSNGNQFSLSFPEGVQRGDISLTNKAVVGVIADGGGSIAANARNVEILAASEFFAGIGEGLGTANAQAGDITVDATGQIELSGTDSLISNSVQAGAVGNAGNITIKTNSLSVTDGGLISSSTFGKGDSGNISITADNTISLDLADIVNNVQSREAEGNAGKIDITTGSLSVTNGAQINSFTRGKGSAGNIAIEATDAVTFDGFYSYEDSIAYSALNSNVYPGAVGNGGNVNITARSLSLTNGAELDVSVLGKTDLLPGGQGKGGSVNINLRDALKIFDTGSGIFASTGIDAVGRGGDITIQAGNIAIENSGTITSETYGKGDTGDISINTRNLIVKDSQLGSIVHGDGNASTVKIIASDSVELSGEIPGNEEGFPGGILAQLDVTGKGKGGNLYIETRRLSVSDGSKIQAATFGEGNAGSLFIRADDIDVFETEKPNFYSTGIFAGVQLDPRTVELPKGNGGNLTIETRNLSLRNGAEIGSSTVGRGDSGNISITADNSISLDASSSIVNSVQSSDAVGNAGKINITTGSLSATNGSQINSFTRGRGDAGDITIQAKDAVIFDGVDSNENYSSLFSTVEAGGNGNGGNINITAPSLSLTNGAKVDSSTFARGNAGRIDITTKNLFAINGGYVSASTFDEGDAGNVKINASDTISIDGSNADSFTGIASQVSSTSKGNAGGIDISAKNLSVINGGTLNAETFGIGNAGNLTIKTGNLIVTNSQVSTSTNSEGDAGNLAVTASDSIDLSGESLDRDGKPIGPGGLLAQADLQGKGKGGSLTVETKRLSISNGGKIQAATFGDGNAGEIKIRASEIDVFNSPDANNIFATEINAGSIKDILARNINSPLKGNAGSITIATDRLNVRNGARIRVSSNGEGKSGSLNIETGTLELSDRAQILANSEGQGNAGNIFAIVRDTLQVNNGEISTSSSRSSGGAIAISAKNIRLRGDSDIRTNVASGAGSGGDIILTADSIIAFDDSDILAFAQDGAGGNITLNTLAFFSSPPFRPAPAGTNPSSLNGNNRVDINATGAVSGVVTVPDVSFIQNSLTELPENPIDTNALIANSCIARRDRGGTFTVTGAGGLPNRPGDATVSPYPTGDVRGVESDRTSNDSTHRPWKIGDPIVEPQAAYRLADGQTVLSRECEK